MPLNRSQQLPAPYKRLTDGLKQNQLQENDCTTDNLTNNTQLLNCDNWCDTTHFDLKMTTARVVETSVTTNNNSPIKDYVHPDDQTQATYEKTPGFKPFTSFKYSNKEFLRCHSGNGNEKLKAKKQ